MGTMADGSLQPVASLRRGQLVLCGAGAADGLQGKAARVRCVVKTHCAQSRCELVELNSASGATAADSLLVTPWHPVRVPTRRDGAAEGVSSQSQWQWQFPASLGPTVEHVDCDAIYSFVLEGGHTMVIGGVECVTLGHNFSGEVVGHPYFGSTAVLKDLAQTSGWEPAGLVELRPGPMLRQSDDGSIDSAMVMDLGREMVRANVTPAVGA